MARFNEQAMWGALEGAPVYPDPGALHDQSYEWKAAIECLKAAKRRNDAEEERRQRWLSQTGAEAE